MSLSSIYTELHRNAARTGQDRAMELKGGARLAVRVKEGIVTLTISRGKGKKIGPTELEVFRRDCAIPATAIRFPLEGQGQRVIDGETWFYIAYRWAEVE